MLWQFLTHMVLYHYILYFTGRSWFSFGQKLEDCTWYLDYFNNNTPEQIVKAIALTYENPTSFVQSNKRVPKYSWNSPR